MLNTQFLKSLHLIIISTTAVFFLSGCTTLQNDRPPFASFTGRDLVLQRTAVLSEYPAHKSERKDVLWENGKPTEFVLDDRFMVKPVRAVKTSWGSEDPLYPLKDYPARQYQLSDKDPMKSSINDGLEGGPLAVYQLPKGTPVRVTRTYTFNGIDSICHEVDGTTRHPVTGTEITFNYVLGCGDKIARAPWEDDSVPSERFVGWDGKGYKKEKGAK